MDELEYITLNALMMCDQGAAPDFFKPTYNTKVKIHGCLVATNKDATPLINIPSFKVCKITGGPCVPATIPMTWQDTWQVKVKGINSLIGKSSCRCPVGGKVEFMTSGQVPLPDDAAQEVKEMQDQAQKELDDSGQGNSVGEAGLVEGMIPVWGSGRDLINDIQTGDVGGSLMNAGFLIWDVASIAVGVVSFGTGTVAMQGAKAGIKGAIKAGAKAVSKEALQQMGKAAFKKLGKSALKSAEKLQAKLCNITKVFGCFTAETLIQTPTGLQCIKDIKVGDEVFSFNEEIQKVTIRKVTYLFEEEVQEILEIETEEEVISTTRNHPFFVNGEFKDAEQIEIGEYLFTCNGNLVKVLSLNYIPKVCKVYNFEVGEDHCYFVGKEGVLVLNICPKLLESLLSQVPDAFKGMFKCKEYAEALKKILQEKGIEGAEVFLKSDTGFIWSEALGKTITTNGDHVGIKVKDLIFDNLNPKGIPYEKWLEDLGVGFPGMQKPIINPF